MVNDNIEEEMVLHVKTFTDSPSNHDDQLNLIKIETSKDLICGNLKEHFLNGWPNDKIQVDDGSKPFWTFKKEIHVIDDLIC